MTDRAGTTCLNCGTYAYNCHEGAVREATHCCDLCSHRLSRYEQRFSAREVQIIRGVAHGLTDPQIADALGISLNTLDTRLRNARRKTRHANRYELAAAVTEQTIPDEAPMTADRWDVHVTSVRAVGVRLFQPQCSCDWAGLLYPTTYSAGLVAAEHANGWNSITGDAS